MFVLLITVNYVKQPFALSVSCNDETNKRPLLLRYLLLLLTEVLSYPLSLVCDLNANVNLFSWLKWTSFSRCRVY